MSSLTILRAGPLTTIQDAGRPGMLRFGIAASGPMDRGAFEAAGAALDVAGAAGIEFTRAGIELTSDDMVNLSLAGGEFRLTISGEAHPWPFVGRVEAGLRVSVVPGAAGNYGYLRLDREFAVPLVLGSRATSSIAGLGGFEGRALRAGDVLPLAPVDATIARNIVRNVSRTGPVRVIWGIHADLFPSSVRQMFVSSSFAVSERLDRMGVRLRDEAGVFAESQLLSLVSDAVVPGDIQILGDGTPIVLMRDHQPTGGYPRIATVLSAELDRFAQLRPGTMVRFEAVTLERARREQ